MIKHIVCWKIKDSAEGQTKKENITQMRDMLLSLKNKISVIREIEVGVNSNKADSTNDDIVVIVTFETFKQLDEYMVHPEHIKVGGFISNIKENRVCIDYEC